MGGEGKFQTHVAARLLIQRPSTMPHNDLWLQLKAVEPWIQHNYGLWTGASRRGQQNQEYRGGEGCYEAAVQAESRG